MSVVRQTNVFDDLIEEGQAEGQVQGLRLSLEVVLAQRFGRLPVAVAAALDACDAAQLTALLPVAVTVDSVAAFQAQLPVGRD